MNARDIDRGGTDAIAFHGPNSQQCWLAIPIGSWTDRSVACVEATTRRYRPIRRRFLWRTAGAVGSLHAGPVARGGYAAVPSPHVRGSRSTNTPIDTNRLLPYVVFWSVYINLMFKNKKIQKNIKNICNFYFYITYFLCLMKYVIFYLLFINYVVCIGFYKLYNFYLLNCILGWIFIPIIFNKSM
jgi:hypothetical protein